MQTIRVAAVSMNSPLGEQEQTMRRIADYCQRAAAEQVDLVVFPELIVHGHCTPNTWDIAEPVPDGASVAKLVELAQQYGLFVSAGLSEKEDDIVFNTQVLVGPDGYIGRQRKLHMSRDESFYYKGGREVGVFDIGKCKIASVICYDNQFPEVARIAALKGADIILMPHAARERRWEDNPESEAAARRHVFDFFSGYRQRARENACFCVYADQAGVAGYVNSLPRDHWNQPHHPGGAMFIGPDGTILQHTQLERIQDEMIVQDLEASLLAKCRSHPNYTLRTRRPELFAELVREADQRLIAEVTDAIPPARFSQKGESVMQIRKADERGHANHGWLDTYHTFSFSTYQDPEHTRFRSLRVMNEDVVAPGQGFGTHPHRDMEIVTYVLAGALEHKDSMGNGEVLRPGEFQRMSAGTGITHSEFNPSSDEPVHLYQIWLFPERKGIEPSYEQKRFAEQERHNRLRLVASRDAADGSLLIHQDARVYLSSLDQGRSVDYELAPGRHAWLQVLRGSVTLNGQSLETSDGVAVSEQRALEIVAAQSAEIMMFDLN